MIELFVYLLILILDFCFKTFIKLIVLSFKAIVWIFAFVFALFDGDSPSSVCAPRWSYSSAPRNTHYDDPIEKAMDRFENHPEDMDLEDEFWIDEILGDKLI